MLSLLLLLVAVPPQEVVDYAARSNAERVERAEVHRATLAKLEARLVIVRKGRIDRTAPGVVYGDGYARFPSAQIKQATIKELETAIADQRTAMDAVLSAEHYGRFPYSVPKVGLIGTLRDSRVWARQVIGDKEMLVDIFWYAADLPKQTQFLLRGVPSDGVVDDTKLELSGVYKITGTYGYINVFGAKRTVFVIEPVDVAPWADLFRPK